MRDGFHSDSKEMNRPTVSIIIPNWNGLVHLKDCFDAIGRQTLRPLETIMVDNGSTDGSFEFVQRKYPHVHIIGLSENLGFAFAVNRGIECARGEFIALLNNDTELDSCWLEALAFALNNDPTLGSVACKMVNFYDRTLIDSAGDGLTRFGSPYSRGYRERDGVRFSRRELVFGTCAGAALYRKEVFTAVGQFDEDFVSYYEDVDLSLRAQLAGFKCLYVPEAVCYHKRGATSSNSASYPIRMQERNLTAFYIKNFPLIVLLGQLPFILASRVRRMYRSVRAGWGRPTWQGFVEGLVLVPRMLKKRRSIQRSRIVSIGYVNSLMRRRT
jgi:GT2 family glycosyltransferase